MARAIEKGATYLDKLCHKLYDEPKGRGFPVDGKCCRCGGPLVTYYCEDRLHLIVCEKCCTLALTKAVAPQVAANLTLRKPSITPPNEWVSVEERLPERNGGYIVTTCDEGCPAGEGIWYDTVVVFAEYYDGCWTWNDGTEYDLTDIVTHWMPLPAPPAKEDQK